MGGRALETTVTISADHYISDVGGVGLTLRYPPRDRMLEMNFADPAVGLHQGSYAKSLVKRIRNRRVPLTKRSSSRRVPCKIAAVHHAASFPVIANGPYTSL